MLDRSMDELNNLSDQEKLSYLDPNTDLSTFKKRQLISSISDDDIKSSLFNKHANEFNAHDKTVIIKSFSQDSIKIDYLKIYENDFRSDLKSQILISIEDDNTKIGCLNNLKTPLYTQNQADVLQSLKSDEMKIEYLDKEDSFLTSNHKRMIIETLSTDKLKSECLDKFIDSLLPKESAGIINSLDDDEIKKRYLDRIFDQLDGGSISMIVSSFKKDEDKLEYLEFNNKLFPLSDRLVIVKSLSDDKLKIQVLRAYNNVFKSYSKAFVIKSIKDDHLKVEILDDDEFGLDLYDHRNILSSFKNEELKANYIFTHYKYLSLSELVPIIATLSDMQLKKEFVEKNEYKLSIAEKFEIIESVKSDKNAVYISSLENDDSKIDFLHNSSYPLSGIEKARIVSSFEDDDLKIKFLSDFDEDLRLTEKELVLVSFEDDEKRLKAFLDFDEKFDVFKTIRILRAFKSETLLLEALDHIKKDMRSDEMSLVICLFPSEELMIETMTLYNDYLDSERRTRLIGRVEYDKLKVNYLINNQAKISNDERLLAICTLKDKKSLKELGFILDDSHKKTLNLPSDMTFGIEIEAEGSNSEDLLNLFIVLGDWTTASEISLNSGVEVVSPILHDTEKDMYSIGLVCKIMRDLDLYTSRRSGGHIHYGVDFLGKDLKSWEALFTIYNECEEIFYKISNKVGEIPRFRISKHAATNNQDFSKAFKSGEINIKNQKDLDKVITVIRDSRRKGLNLMNLCEGGLNTIEFRMPNGSLEPEVIKENIKLFGSLLEVSKEIGLGSEEKKEKFEKIKNKELSEADKVEALLELLFDNEEERSIYRNRWDSVKDSEVFNELKSAKPTFKRGDYSMKKEAKPIFDKTSVEDRRTFTEEIRREIAELDNRNEVEDQERN